MKNRTLAVLGIFAAIATITVNAASSGGVYPKEVGQYFKLYEEGQAKMIEIAVVEKVGAEPITAVGRYEKLAGESVILDKCGPMKMYDVTKRVNPLSYKTETVQAFNPSGVEVGCPISDKATLVLAP